MKQTMTKQNVTVAIFVMITSLSTACGYDYGVDKSETKLKHRTYYSEEADGNYDFRTVIWIPEEKSKSPNYNQFNISVSHLYKDINEKRDVMKSTIHFDMVEKEQSFKIDPENIHLIHRDLNGKKILPIETVNNFNENKSSKYIRNTFTNVYSSKTLPVQLREKLFIEFNIHGKQVKVLERFNIKKALRYTIWDILQGV